MALTNIASCSSCKLAAKVDGGDGRCPRTADYPELRLLRLHDCPLFKRRPQPRPKSELEQEALF